MATKIRSIEAIPFCIPCKVPRKWARGFLPNADHVLVRITTEDGLVGQAEAMPRPSIYGESQKGIAATIDDWIAPGLIGKDPWNVERIMADLSAIAHNHTAKAAVDMALTDIRAKAAGVPVWKFLGGWSNRVPVSWRVVSLPVDQQIKRMEEIKETYGINAWKVKVGMKVEQDVAQVKTLREAMGPDAIFLLDANQGWNSTTAIRILDEIKGENITLVEEPCPIEDDRGRRRVAASTRIPLMGDEGCTSIMEVRHQLELGAVQVISIKTTRTGFYTSWKIAHMCEQAGVANLCGMQGDTSIGNTCSAHFAAACPNVKLPSESTSFLDTVDDLLVDLPKIENGQMVLSDKPGLGYEIDEAKLKKYRLN